ncbi:synaptonemal complex protein 1-like [Vanessa cardui]|uniref:synaptonemal complex protein 1-like n=1 Tax=Vanessa cardui TaxID=171605 RepID=UPI001F12D61E|nr:synaptonemal complex protein 1-like [Vanessa cardui]
MDENHGHNLDSEYKRYMEIIRPYLGQLLDQDVIEICNAWIQRLSNCKEHEKSLRNKYIFAMCYQLAKGVLEEPFLKYPSADELSLLTDDANSDETLSELEYQIIDLDNVETQVIYDNEKTSLSTIGYLSLNSEAQTDNNKNQELTERNKSFNSMTYNLTDNMYNQNIICYNCSNDVPDFNSNKNNEDSYNVRTKNIIMKLREIKRMNVALQRELAALREELRTRNQVDNLSNDILKVDNATSTCTISQDSTTTLKCKLEEMNVSRNSLLEKVRNLQENLDNFNYIKQHEIEDLEAKHKLQLIDTKASVQEEVKACYEKKLEDLKLQYERTIKEIETQKIKEAEKIIMNKDVIIANKDKTIISQGDEIDQLKNDIKDLKKDHCYLSSKYTTFPNDSNVENFKEIAGDFEKRINKIQKSKAKLSRACEVKVNNLQREKHLMECSLHLELVRQRAQVIQEMSNEHQTELTEALNKLESNYKEIIANVQSTAVQRRMQDQMALESIIQAVCGVRNEGMYTNSAQATCPSQLTNKATRNQTRDCNRNCDVEMPTVFQGNKVGSIIVGGKSFGEESVVNDYCIDSEKLGDLFEKLYIPQRDTSCDTSKK